MINGAPSDPEILDTLKTEHEEVAALLKDLVDGKSGVSRKGLVAKIKTALLPHVYAEQIVLYDALIAIRDRKTQQDGQEGYIEHALAGETLTKLENIADTDSTEFAATAKVLKELIEHHVQEEERNVWADAKEKFSADERKIMNAKYLATKKTFGAVKKAGTAKKAGAIKKTAPAVRQPVKAKAKAGAAAKTTKPAVAAKAKQRTATQSSV
jgi:hypothetical protein